MRRPLGVARLIRRDLPGGTILFDGVCSFCSWSVRFILRHDAKGLLTFASLQSPVGRRMLQEYGLDPTRMDSLLFLHEGRLLAKSDAVLEILRYLGAWRILRAVKVLPRSLRDAIYDLVAANRFRLFGRRSFCFLPTAEERRRFLDIESSGHL